MFEKQTLTIFNEFMWSGVPKKKDIVNIWSNVSVTAAQLSRDAIEHT